MIDEPVFSAMREYSVLVNTARGGIINSDHLLGALRDKQIAGAALDVYEREAQIFGKKFSDAAVMDLTFEQLLHLDNCIVTAHQGFFTQEALINIAQMTLANAQQFVSQGQCDAVNVVV